MFKFYLVQSFMYNVFNPSPVLNLLELKFGRIICPGCLNMSTCLFRKYGSRVSFCDVDSKNVLIWLAILVVSLWVFYHWKSCLGVGVECIFLKIENFICSHVLKLSEYDLVV